MNQEQYQSCFFETQWKRLVEFLKYSFDSGVKYPYIRSKIFDIHGF